MNYYLKVTGVLAITVYVVILGLLFNYFNHHNEHKKIHFVKKNEERVVVAMSAPSSSTKVMNQKSKSKKEAKKKEHTNEKKKYKPKKKAKKKAKKKKLKKKKKIKEKKPQKQKKQKIKKKSQNKKKSEKKKVNNLFDNIKEKKPHKSENKRKSSNNKNAISDKRENKDRGIENSYLAKIQSTLEDWPAQGDFASEKVVIWLRIKSDGSFIFKLLSPSNNQDFNSGLIQYLKQLQKIGFDSHQSSKPYELNIEFIAKE